MTVAKTRTAEWTTPVGTPITTNSSSRSTTASTEPRRFPSSLVFRGLDDIPRSASLHDAVLPILSLFSHGCTGRINPSECPPFPLALALDFTSFSLSLSSRNSVTPLGHWLPLISRVCKQQIIYDQAFYSIENETGSGFLERDGAPLCAIASCRRYAASSSSETRAVGLYAKWTTRWWQVRIALA